ncbi:MAG: hypothetical protein IJV83_01400 [Clostridia bacterium]|nr:hypothetical protein [Clostridia bacterium]
MRKNLTKALALALCALTAAPAVACGGGGGGGVEVDESKTQLYVYHYDAGYGNKWINELARNFETKMAGYVNGEKTGVQVIISGDMTTRTADGWRAETYDVMFLEGPGEFYQMMRDGVVENLDSIMKVPNAEDNNQKIEDKMTQQQKDAYTFTKGEETHYYGIPHYAGHYGIIYNKEIFDENGFYYDADGNLILEEITDANRDLLSYGPDGRTGVENGIDYSLDDGLPTTYDEFFDLCIEIDANGIDPVCTPGMYYEQHIMHCLDNLVAAHEGAAQMNLNFTFNGTANDLVVIEDGEIVYEDDGVTPKTESLDINDDNAYNLSRQSGKFYAMQFMERLLGENDHYNEEDSLNKAVTHLEMQQKFLENGTRGVKENAMLIDGVWWQMEADATFDRMARNLGEEYSKYGRDFAWMPLPQPTAEDAAKVASGEKNSVYLDYLRAVACVKANLSDVSKELALGFLQYAYTDQSLANFTYTTGTTIGVDYLDAVDRSRLTPYEKSLINYIQKSDFVTEISGNVKYLTSFQSYGSIVNKYTAGTLAKNIVDAITDVETTAEAYFLANQTEYKNSLWSNK